MVLTPVPNDQLATVVTSLEMRTRPKARPFPPSPLRLVPWVKPSPEAYRALFKRIGAPWLWFSRIAINNRQLIDNIHDDGISISAIADRQGLEVGIVELDFRQSGECEIAFLGLIPELTGRGQGGWLMAQTLAMAWRHDVTRVWVHTCTLDHPSALSYYIKSGFTPFARAIETFPDPRIAGLLPTDAAPQIPLLADNLR